MPSIHPDYEYDIFISYRQNDNKRDGWVTNFVDALRDELEATLKNPVSIYFDENPHDGLLETHQVDASLAKKLKCLVFIPIVSQTYCDTSSFAWEHEFMPFIKMAKEDELGMNITLSNGNVVTRVLPVKIHDLDTEDQHTLEAVLDGPLRSIDFIYKEPGVCRALLPNDDRTTNLTKADYRNQINKVANALKDIGTSIINQADREISVPATKTGRPPEIKSSKKGVYYIGLSIIIIALLGYWGYRQFYSSPPAELEDVTIAVLAFDFQSSDGDLEWLGEGFPGAIRDALNNVNGLQVIGKASSQSFKGKNATIEEIGEALNVKSLLGGSVSKVGNKLRITAQLIDVDTDLQVWNKTYNKDWGDVYAIMDEVAQNVTKELIGELSIKELKEIKVTNEVNPEAYEYYLKGMHFHLDKYMPNRDIDYFEQSERMFLKAISIDSGYAAAYAGLAYLYDTRVNAINAYEIKRDSVTSIAYKINPGDPLVLMMMGNRFVTPNDINIDSALFYFIKARELEPRNIMYSYPIVDLFWRIGLFENVVSLTKKSLKSDPLNLYNRAYLAWSLEPLGKYKDAKEQLIKLLEIEPTNPIFLGPLLRLALFYDKDLEEAKRIYNILEQVETIDNIKYDKALLLAAEGKREEALILSKGFYLYSLLNMKEEAIDRADSISLVTNYTTSFYTYTCLINDKATEFIREEPKFKEVLARAKVVHEERIRKYGHYFDEE